MQRERAEHAHEAELHRHQDHEVSSESRTRFKTGGALPATLGGEHDGSAMTSASDLVYGASAKAADMTTEHDDKHPPQSQLPKDAHKYEAMNGLAFVKGEGDQSDVDPNDVNQGQLGDCWFLSGLAAVARANPDAIRRLIKDNGDFTYDVTLYLRDYPFGPKTKHVFRVDSQFPADKDGSPAYAGAGDRTAKGNPEQWVMLLEKAYATHKGRYQGSFRGMDGGLSKSGIEAVTPGSTSMYFPFAHSEQGLAHQIAGALREHRPVTAGAGPVLLPESQKRADSIGLTDRHLYSVKSVDEKAMTISLQNPWGHAHLDNISIKDFKFFFNQYAIGEPAR